MRLISIMHWGICDMHLKTVVKRHMKLFALLQNCTNFWHSKYMNSGPNCIIPLALHPSVQQSPAAPERKKKKHISCTQSSGIHYNMSHVRGNLFTAVFPRLLLTQRYTFAHRSGWHVTQLLLLRAEDEPNYKMIYEASIRHRAENQVGKSTGSTILLRWLFWDVPQFPSVPGEE